MDKETLPPSREHSFQRIVDTAIRLSLLFVLAILCFNILKPFLLPVVWGVILAVALSPLFNRLVRMMGGRRKLAAMTFCLLGLALLLVPSYFFFSSLIEGSIHVVDRIHAGTIEIPAPADSVKEWPIIGDPIYKEWLAASQNTEGAFTRFKPQIMSVVSGIGGIATGLGRDLLLLVIATLLASVFLATSDSGIRAFQRIFTRLIGERGPEMVRLTADTIRNVAKGVVGVALIQTALCGIGLLMAGVPAAGLWILLVLILAVIQLPPTLIMLPIIVYQFGHMDTVPAVIFTIWSLVAAASDNFLKPLLLGRGMETPMLVILLGALGGMIWAGIIGLFIGAVILSIGYELLLAWLGTPDPMAGEEEPAAETR